MSVHQRMQVTLAARSAWGGKPYDLGQHDCFLAGMSIADGLTGSGHADAHRGSYATRKGALKQLVKHGHDGVEDFMDSHFTRCGQLAARVGDLGFCRIEKEDHVCWCLGDRFETLTEDGLSVVSREALLQVWAVGA